MATRSDLYKSKYLKADTIPNGCAVVRIRSTGTEVLKGFNGESTRKLVLYLSGGLAPLIVPVTVFDTIADFLHKDNSDDWAGDEIEVYAATVEVNGQMKPCVRVRAPAQGTVPLSKRPAAPAPKAAGAASDMADEIPF